MSKQEQSIKILDFLLDSPAGFVLTDAKKREIEWVRDFLLTTFCEPSHELACDTAWKSIMSKVEASIKKLSDLGIDLRIVHTQNSNDEGICWSSVQYEILKILFVRKSEGEFYSNEFDNFDFCQRLTECFDVPEEALEEIAFLHKAAFLLEKIGGTNLFTLPYTEMYIDDVV